MKGKIKNMKPKREKTKKSLRNKEGITLIALVITIVLNCSYLAME